MKDLDPEIRVMAFEQMGKRIPGADPDFICAEIGQREDLSLEKLKIAAAGLSNAARTYPKPRFLLSIGGYDQDPRELWEIPEVRAYVRGFVTALEVSVLGRLEENSRILLAACCGFIQPKGRNPENGNIVFDVVPGGKLD